MSDADEKKKLYAQILAAADDELLLERMRELGFWPEDEALPDDPEDEAKEWLQLEDAIARLRKKAAVAEDPDEALRKERVRRWNESKKRRARTRIETQLEAKARREAWEAAKATRVWHAGEGVSAGLDASSTPPEAPRFGVPTLADPNALAAAIGIPLGELRWLTYHRQAAPLVHYHRYDVPKKTGGRRTISAPKPKLARAQDWVLRHVLVKGPTHPAAHGFLRGKSVASNAAPHVGRRVLVNLDLEDFFPSVGFRRVKGVFHRLFGYPEPVAVCLALLCTEPPRVAAELDGRELNVAVGARQLPQGACTSPALTNLLCRRLDARLAGIARGHGFRYTRYADDLSFSADDRAHVGRLLWCVRQVTDDEGFRVNEAKTRVMPAGRRQEVTGVVVNEKLSTPRDERRRLRALLHNAKRTGLAAQNRAGHPQFRAHLRGRIAWMGMFDAAGAAKLRAQLDGLRD